MINIDHQPETYQDYIYKKKWIAYQESNLDWIISELGQWPDYEQRQQVLGILQRNPPPNKLAYEEMKHVQTWQFPLQVLPALHTTKNHWTINYDIL